VADSPATKAASAKDWLNLPENEIGFDCHKSDERGPLCGDGITDPTCERCAVEIACAAYGHYRETVAVEAERKKAEGLAEALREIATHTASVFAKRVADKALADWEAGNVAT
jgi:hypothetical protein